MKIFSGSSNKPLAENIAKGLGTSLSPLEIFIFPDKERRIRIEEDVVDEDTIVVQSTATPADTNYMELFFIADALKRSGAHSITAVVSYLGYQRQDHVFRSGEAVSLQVVIEAMEAAGVTKIVALDLHTIKIPEFFHIPISHLSALPLFADRIKKEQWTDSVLVSPDMGGIRRIKILSEMLSNMSYGMIVKNRDLATGEVEATEFQGPANGSGLKGRRAVIVDDMASSGKTIVNAANLLAEMGTQEIQVFVTHPIFSTDAPNLLQSSIVENVFVTDSVFVPKEKHFAKLEILTVADMIAQELRDKS